MNDYIMNRESLKQHCEVMCKKFKDVPTSGIYSEHKLVLDLLEQTEWIPVSERLPEIGQRILVTYNQEDEIKIDITNYSKYGFLVSVAIAWMPLPEPYKGE